MRAHTNTFQNGRKNSPASVVKLAAKRNGAAKRPAAPTVVELAGGPANAAREDLRPGLVAGSAARPASAVIASASGEKIQKAMKKWSENVEAFSQAGSAVSHAAQEISREWVGWTRTGAQNSQKGFMALMQCRSPQEFFEVHGRILNLNLELLAASTKRMTEISAEMTNKASRKITPAA